MSYSNPQNPWSHPSFYLWRAIFQLIALLLVLLWIGMVWVWRKLRA